MTRIVIEPKDDEEANLIKAILEKMNIKAQDLSDEALEDYIIGQETIEGSKTHRVSEQAIRAYLNNQDEN
jgi:hypothetical protein